MEWVRSSRCEANHCVEVAAPGLTWARASRCEIGNCVEVARDDRVHMRDSEHPGGPTLTFDAAAWAVFLGDVKADRLTR